MFFCVCEPLVGRIDVVVLVLLLADPIEINLVKLTKMFQTQRFKLHHATNDNVWNGMKWNDLFAMAEPCLALVFCLPACHCFCPLRTCRYLSFSTWRIQSTEPALI